MPTTFVHKQLGGMRGLFKFWKSVQRKHRTLLSLHQTATSGRPPPNQVLFYSQFSWGMWATFLGVAMKLFCFFLKRIERSRERIP